MSLYGTGNGGILQAGDIIISLLDTVKDTGQKLVAPTGQEVDPATYPDLASALGWGGASTPSNALLTTVVGGTIDSDGLGATFTNSEQYAYTADLSVLSGTLSFKFTMDSGTAANNAGIYLVGDDTLKGDHSSQDSILYNKSGWLWRKGIFGSNLNIGKPWGISEEVSIVVDLDANSVEFLRGAESVHTADISGLSTIYIGCGTVGAAGGETAIFSMVAPLVASLNPTMPDLSAKTEDFKMVQENVENAGTTPDFPTGPDLSTMVAISLSKNSIAYNSETGVQTFDSSIQAVLTNMLARDGSDTGITFKRYSSGTPVYRDDRPLGTSSDPFTTFDTAELWLSSVSSYFEIQLDGLDTSSIASNGLKIVAHCGYQAGFGPWQGKISLHYISGTAVGYESNVVTTSNSTAEKAEMTVPANEFTNTMRLRFDATDQYISVVGFELIAL